MLFRSWHTLRFGACEQLGEQLTRLTDVGWTIHTILPTEDGVLIVAYIESYEPEEVINSEKDCHEEAQSETFSGGTESKAPRPPKLQRAKNTPKAKIHSRDGKTVTGKK